MPRRSHATDSVEPIERASQQAATDLQRHIKSYIGVSAFVVICDPGTVERSIGKAKRVIHART